MRISGGLGNQLFQIAAGYYLKQNLGRDVCLVLADEINTPVRLGISEFIVSLEMETTQSKEVLHLELCELEIANLNDFSSLPEGKLIFGYFQDWRIVNTLEGFVGLLRQSLPSSNWDFFHKNQSEDCVSVHFRYGDYISNLHALGVLDASYYRNAISRLDLQSPLKFLVFSDSPSKADQVFKKILPKFDLVDDSLAGSPLEIMVALSSSNQIILSNSTFSWWASCIGTQRRRVAPFPFYRDLGRDFLLPPSWEIVQSKFINPNPTAGERLRNRIQNF